ncbi:hypothetical protein M0D21_01520 [Aquimarina sp. D1M17]|uniref:PKD domain-containing protein n=1 Tax=Aquimarina acroporae TaxID=2937283 RepID=UPI0020BDEB8A|nr:hypothetical protein [Aquimarina acroporae]MCK8520223.1 hypothetical protein [Aquimarina acroporae]
MEKVEVFLEVENGIIIGFQDYEIDTSTLPKGTKIVKAKVEQPDLLLGLEEKYISSKPSTVEKLLTQKIQNLTLQSKKADEPLNDFQLKSKLKSLLIDIQLADELDEDVSDLKREFEKLKKAYKALKKDSITKVDAGRARTITLPSNKTNLNGDVYPTKGEIKSVSWSKVKGSGGRITNPNSLTTTATGLKKGYYEFKLSVTNDQGKVISDIVKVTVLGKEKRKDEDED